MPRTTTGLSYIPLPNAPHGGLFAGDDASFGDANGQRKRSPVFTGRLFLASNQAVQRWLVEERKMQTTSHAAASSGLSAMDLVPLAPAHRVCPSSGVEGHSSAPPLSRAAPAAVGDIDRRRSGGGGTHTTMLTTTEDNGHTAIFAQSPRHVVVERVVTTSPLDDDHRGSGGVAAAHPTDDAGRRPNATIKCRRDLPSVVPVEMSLGHTPYTDGGCTQRLSFSRNLSAEGDGGAVPQGSFFPSPGTECGRAATVVGTSNPAASGSHEMALRGFSRSYSTDPAARQPSQGGGDPSSLGSVEVVPTAATLPCWQPIHQQPGSPAPAPAAARTTALPLPTFASIGNLFQQEGGLSTTTTTTATAAATVTHRPVEGGPFSHQGGWEGASSATVPTGVNIARPDYPRPPGDAAAACAGFLPALPVVSHIMSTTTLMSFDRLRSITTNGGPLLWPSSSSVTGVSAAVDDDGQLLQCITSANDDASISFIGSTTVVPPLSGIGGSPHHHQQQHQPTTTTTPGSGEGSLMLPSPNAATGLGSLIGGLDKIDASPVVKGGFWKLEIASSGSHMASLAASQTTTTTTTTTTVTHTDDNDDEDDDEEAAEEEAGAPQRGPAGGIIASGDSGTAAPSPPRRPGGRLDAASALPHTAATSRMWNSPQAPTADPGGDRKRPVSLLCCAPRMEAPDPRWYSPEGRHLVVLDVSPRRPPSPSCDPGASSPFCGSDPLRQDAEDLFNRLSSEVDDRDDENTNHNDVASANAAELLTAASSSSVTRFLRVPFADGPSADLPAVTNAAVPWLREQLRQGRDVVVYCQQGRSRSVSVVIRFFMTTFGFSCSDALTWVRQYRPGADPNAFFLMSLQQLESCAP